VGEEVDEGAERLPGPHGGPEIVDGPEGLAAGAHEEAGLTSKFYTFAIPLDLLDLEPQDFRSARVHRATARALSPLGLPG
jgi:hypothetical protein